MALTHNDLKLIREILQPEFDGLKTYVDQRFKEQDKRFEVQDQKFNELEKNVLNGFREIIEEVYEDFHIVNKKVQSHEVRITRLEV